MSSVNLAAILGNRVWNRKPLGARRFRCEVYPHSGQLPMPTRYAVSHTRSRCVYVILDPRHSVTVSHQSTVEKGQFTGQTPGQEGAAAVPKTPLE